MSRDAAIAAAITLALLLLCVGTMDARDQDKEAQDYCAMVRSGAWPDYRNDVSCEGE